MQQFVYLARSVRTITLMSYGVLASSFVHQTAMAQDANSASQIEQLQREISAQRRQLDALQQELTLQKMRLNVLTGNAQSEPLSKHQGRGRNNIMADAGTVEPVRSGNQAESDQTVDHVPQVAPIFEQPGVLTPKGHYTLEPSIQYGYSSNNRVALIGYTVIPALLIGLIDVREVKRNSVTGALTGRAGISNRFEVEMKIPYVYRSDNTVSREIFTGSATDRVFETSGKSIGDIELGARYQLNAGGPNSPYFISTLRYKSRTGKDPFQVVTDCVTRCVGNATGTGLPLDLPTGSGFQSIQPGLTWLFPSDPAVFFGSFSYTHNFGRQNLSRRILNGGTEPLGSVKPGDILGVNFGMGLALNEKSSFSVGFDINSVGPTRQNGIIAPGSVRSQLGTLLLGYSYRMSERTSISVAVGAGLTRDTPDLTLNLKLPISF